MADNNGARNVGPDLEGYGAAVNGGPPYQPVYVVGGPNAPSVPGQADQAMLPAVRYSGMYPAPPEQTLPPAPNYLKIAIQHLRGRIIMALVLAVICAAGAAAAVWKFVRPTYASESLVRIEYARPVVLQQTDANQPMQRFDAFMASQRTLITSRRVVDMAIQDPIWKASGCAVPQYPDQYFADHLTVATQRDSEFIEIIVSDNLPTLPAAAVTAITNAYVQLYTSNEKQTDRDRYGVLEDRQSTLQHKIDDLQNKLRSAAMEYGTTNLTMFVAEAQDQVSKLNDALANVELAMTNAPTTRPAGETAAAFGTPTSQPSFASVSIEAMRDQIAQFDPTMHALVDDAAKCKDQIEQLHAKGMGDKHPQVQDLQHQLDLDNAKIQKRLEWQIQFREASGHFADQLAGDGLPGASVVGKSLDQLKADKVKLEALKAQALKELQVLGLKDVDAQRLQSDLRDTRDELDKVTKRLESLHTESALGGRLSVITSGEIPLAPSHDPRLKYGLAAAGAGGLLPISLIIAFGMFGGRYRYSTETEGDVLSDIPFLGILPELGGKDLNNDCSVAAAHSIHQIRVAVQAQSQESGSHVYLVTSATASEGKTGLSMALGLSFSAAELRTLVIDFDLVGRSLTSRLDVKDEAGVSEALIDGTMQPMCREVGPSLWVLPAGRGDTGDAYAITAAKVRRLLQEAREHFDVVVVDTGPVLGSIEANVLARECDGVILAVARGRTRGIVRNAVRRLHSLGARPLGFVFNRAKATDFQHSPYSSSSVTSLAAAPNGNGRRSSIVTPAPTNGEQARLKELGPLVSAVAKGSGATNGTSFSHDGGN